MTQDQDGSCVDIGQNEFRAPTTVLVQARSRKSSVGDSISGSRKEYDRTVQYEQKVFYFEEKQLQCACRLLGKVSKERELSSSHAA